MPLKHRLAWGLAEHGGVFLAGTMLGFVAGVGLLAIALLAPQGTAIAMGLLVAVGLAFWLAGWVIGGGR